LLSYDDAGELLDAFAEELPAEFFNELNGGVVLSERKKRHPDVRGVYILGEYHHEHVLGRYIIIYYGSLAAVCAGESDDYFAEELRKTLRHEFTHHVESLAGERGLERKDEERMRRYRRLRKPK
jgi:predicted Zn-dependent protease with MMP-like domain